MNKIKSISESELEMLYTREINNLDWNKVVSKADIV